MNFITFILFSNIVITLIAQNQPTSIINIKQSNNQIKKTNDQLILDQIMNSNTWLNENSDNSKSSTKNPQDRSKDEKQRIQISKQTNQDDNAAFGKQKKQNMIIKQNQKISTQNKNNKQLNTNYNQKQSLTKQSKNQQKNIQSHHTIVHTISTIQNQSNNKKQDSQKQKLMYADQFLKSLDSNIQNIEIKDSSTRITQNQAVISKDQTYKQSNKNILQNAMNQNKEIKKNINDLKMNEFSIRLLLVCMSVVGIIYVIKYLVASNEKENVRVNMQIINEQNINLNQQNKQMMTLQKQNQQIQN